MIAELASMCSRPWDVVAWTPVAALLSLAYCRWAIIAG